LTHDESTLDPIIVLSRPEHFGNLEVIDIRSLYDYL